MDVDDFETPTVTVYGDDAGWSVAEGMMAHIWVAVLLVGYEGIRRSSLRRCVARAARPTSGAPRRSMSVR